MGSQSNTPAGDSAIAIIGMAGRFPGAPDLRQYWRNLCEGVESITFFSEEELVALGVDPALVRKPNYVRAAAMLEGAELFDPEFFGFNPREAEILDPQQRMFLECAWEALEDAGYDPDRYSGAIGLFAGAGFNTYFLNNVLRNPKVLDAVGFFQAVVANQNDYLTTRVAYKLNLTGPAVTVGTACSTSLVAVHLACQSLAGFECDMALAGGTSVKAPQKTGYLYQEGGIVSPDGHCRAFDRRAQGTVLGSGAGVVLLKRLQDALDDGDRVEAVIRGSALNNDGAVKVGFTAPSLTGQARVIAEALGVAGVPAESISYVETHGTGTALGDPIEIEALSKVFRRETSAEQFCFIGSVKTNIGHADAAAGVAGLIKTVLALKNRKLPKSLHYEAPNPEMDMAHSPFIVPTGLTDWGPAALPRRAGVSAFGFGGTNAHVILEEAPGVEPSGHSRPCTLLTLSARTEEALETATDNLAAVLERDTDLSLPDVGFTLQVGRKIFAHRRIAVCANKDEARSVLAGRDPQRCFTRYQARKEPEVAFLFPGQGAQYVGMGRGLFESEKVFREEVTRCSRILEAHLALDLTELLFPAPGGEEGAAKRLTGTQIAQPAIFAVSYALAKMWMGWGVKPAALIGHSVGEYAAAAVAGVMSLETALGLVAARGRLMGSLPGGSMVALALPADEVEPLLDVGLVIAAINGPATCVVSGSVEAVDRWVLRMAAGGIHCRELHTSHAFHSPMMDPILGPFHEEVARVELSPPTIPIVSTVTGELLRPEEARDPAYWARNLRQTVRFGDAIRTLLENENVVLLETGPGNTLGSLALQNRACSDGHTVLASLRHPQDPQPDSEFVTTTLGRMWLAGVEPDWLGYYQDEKRRRVALPTYPFERRRCWIDPSSAAEHTAPEPLPQPETRPTSGWMSVPIWRPQPIPRDAGPALGSRHCLVVSDGGVLGHELIDRLRLDDALVTSVVPGERFSRVGPNAFAVDPRNPQDFETLIRSLATHGALPEIVVILGTPAGPPGSGRSSRPGSLAHEELFESLIYTARALLPETGGSRVRMLAVTRGAHTAGGAAADHPEMATAFGPCRVIPQEYPNVECRQLDLEAPRSGESVSEIAAHVLTELSVSGPEAVVAYRGGSRWVEAYESLPARQPGGLPKGLRREGVYLVTGGLGGVGLVLAEYLARECRAKLVLVSRSGLPDRGEWDALLQGAGTPDPLRHRISEIRRMEAHGAEVLVCRADVSDRNAMREVQRTAVALFGTIHGIVHAAGTPGSGSIRSATRENMDAVLSPKVDGTLVLRDLFQDAGLDLVVFCSSIASVLGGIGQADYCAASRFLDTFAHGRRFGRGTLVTSIAWPAWREVGMAAASAVARDPAISITPAEALDVFARILEDPPPHVLVAPETIERLMERAQASPSLVAPSFAGERGVRAGDQAGIHATAAGTPEEIEGLLARLWQELLGVAKIGPHDHFLHLGGNSLLAIRLFERIETELGVQLSLATIFQQPTVRQLAEAIGKKRAGLRRESPGPESLVEIKTGGPGQPFFLVHALGGGVLNYRELIEHLGDGPPVYGLIARGLDGKQEPLASIEEMASVYLREILAKFPEGPYHLGGFSFGAQVAYEMARQLREQGRPVGLLAILDQCPTNAKRGPTWSPSAVKNFATSLRYVIADLRRESASNIAFRVGRRIRIGRKLLAFKLMRGSKVPNISLGDVRRMSDFEEVRHKLLEAEFRAVVAYVPKPYPGRVTLFRARGQGVFNSHDTTLGWKRLALDGVEVHHLNGSHQNFLREPCVKELALAVSGCLDRARNHMAEADREPALSA